MINYIKKDVTTVDRGVVVHGVNCQGVMGSGVALAVKKKWPRAFERYVKVCEMVSDKEDLLGLAHMVLVTEGVYVGNLFTQVKYGKDGKKYAVKEAVEMALGDALMHARAMRLPLYMPKIGCGLGGLDWKREVKPIVEHLADEYKDVEINVCDI